jgi:hypothetical protein
MWIKNRWYYQDEANGEADGGGGKTDGEGTEKGGGENLHGDDHSGGGGEGHPAGAGKEDAPKDMLAAIDQGLGYKEKPEVDPATGKPKEVAGEIKPAVEEKHPNGAPKKNEKGEELDQTGKVVPKQAKTAAELAMTPQQIAALKPEARARFQEVIGTLKEREATIAQMTEKMTPLREARDAMIDVLEETKTTSDQLSAYLEFNRMLQSGDPKDWESALQMVENQRAALYKSLGREPDDGGVDLLAEFPDLKQKVTEAQITREDALEIAQGRRERAAGEQRSQQQRSEQQTVQQRKQAQDNALKEIETWTAGLEKSDIDYKAKEEKLLEQVDEVIKNYPADKWIPTLKLLYSGIAVQKASSPNRGQQPLRPSGAKPGAKAPQNMYEAMWPDSVKQ